MSAMGIIVTSGQGGLQKFERLKIALERPLVLRLIHQKLVENAH
jgi:hypothetical protein